jgi:hypothetical protein
MRLIVLLLYGTALLPIAIAFAALGVLVGSMGDVNGHAVLRAIALVIGFLWVLDLIALILAVAVSHVISLGCCADDGNKEEGQQAAK